MRKLAFVLGLAAALTMAFAPAHAQSAKVSAVFADINILESSDMNWTTVLGPTTIHTSAQKDLFIDVSLECGLYTQTESRSRRGNQDTSQAEAGVEVRVVVDDHAAYPGDVIFARRSQTLQASFQGLIEGCLTVDPDTGEIILDEECVEPETLDLILDTMNAAAYNFIIDDVGVGDHTIEVQARITSGASAQEGTASATASIGKGSMTVEEVRLVRGQILDL